MVVAHLVDIGRRNAVDRVGRLPLELGSRLTLVGLGGGTGYACPLTRYHLADPLGSGAAHVNRVLRILRENGNVTFQDGQVVFGDRPRLPALVKLDPADLNQDSPPLA